MDLATMLAFFQPVALREAIASPNYTDIMINADRSVFVDCDGELKRLDIVAGPLIVPIHNVARELGKDFTREKPILDTRLPDGSRVAALLNQDGTVSLTIRKFNRWFSASELSDLGALPREVLETLSDGIQGRHGDAANIIYSGGTSSGKSTQVKALIDQIPDNHRLIVIEKPRELEISHVNVARWEAEEPAHGKPPARTVPQLVAAALRHRPDHIIIGEVREPEDAYQMLQAMNTGHSGTLCTIHADGAEDALQRIADLALAARPNLNQAFVEKQVRRTIDYVCHVERALGKRAVRELIKVLPDKIEYLYPA